jgi:hypothetical protein
MKIAVISKGLGKSLVLVGALVLGTAFPHLLKAITNTLPWQSVILSTLSAVVGGLMMLILVPNGSIENKSRNPAVSFGGIFKNQNQALPLLAILPHVELYAFWAFTPLILKPIMTYIQKQPLIFLFYLF